MFIFIEKFHEHNVLPTEKFRGHSTFIPTERFRGYIVQYFNIHISQTYGVSLFILETEAVIFRLLSGTISAKRLL